MLDIISVIINWIIFFILLKKGYFLIF
jgi:hypothetical protein